MEEIGVLKSIKVGRETLYINWRLMDLLRWESTNHTIQAVQLIKKSYSKRIDCL
jgi:hypothetical protein